MARNDHRRKPQFSLLNLLFLGMTVAAIAGLYSSRLTIRRLTESRREILAENAKLRAEQGVLTIEDPSMVHAIRIADPRDDVWNYRVYLPPGHRYYLAGQANNLPRNGEPPRFGPGAPPGLSLTMAGRSDRGGAITANGCSPGEHLVSIALSRNDRGEKVFRVNMTPTTPVSGGANIGMAIAEEQGKWPAVELDRSTQLGEMQTGIPSRTQSVVSTRSGPIVLLEMRFMHGNITSSTNSDEGLIVWIGVAEEEPGKNTTGS